jgi:hypothetical protein
MPSSRVTKRSLIQLLIFFCLETKETKVQGYNFLCYKIQPSAKRFELAALKQQIFLNASACILLNATKFKALASIFFMLTQINPIFQRTTGIVIRSGYNGVINIMKS